MLINRISQIVTGLEKSRSTEVYEAARKKNRCQHIGRGASADMLALVKTLHIWTSVELQQAGKANQAATARS